MIMAEMGKIAFKFGGATRMSGLALGVFCAAFTAQAQEQVGATVAEIPVPAGPGSSEPSLFALADGRAAVSWTEPTEAGHAVKVALGNEAGWSAPSTVMLPFFHAALSLGKRCSSRICASLQRAGR